jgi:hypothetical protein
MEAAMSRSARNIGISTEQLGKWGLMAREVGGDVRSVTGSMMGLSDQIAQAQLTGNWGSMLQIFSRFGVNLKFTKEGLADIDDLMDQLNQTFSKMDRPTARALGAMLGLDSSTIELLSQQRSAFIESRDAAAQLAKGYAEAGKASEGLYREVEKTRGAIETWVSRTVGYWAPQLTEIAKKIREWFELTQTDPESGAGGNVVRGAKAQMERFLGKSPWQDSSAGPPLDLSDPRAGNMAKFLRGLGFLESGFDPNAKNPTSSARGAFQFIDRTAQQSINAGLGDPRAGGFSDQAGVAERWIRMFKPEAARAIDAGNWKLAEELLKSTFPSLPGGTQTHEKLMPQFESILAGGGPRPGGGVTNSTSTTNIGTVNVNISGADSAEETGRSVYRWFQRFNQGTATYNGPR